MAISLVTGHQAAGAVGWQSHDGAFSSTGGTISGGIYPGVVTNTTDYPFWPILAQGAAGTATIVDDSNGYTRTNFTVNTVIGSTSLTSVSPGSFSVDVGALLFGTGSNAGLFPPGTTIASSVGGSTYHASQPATATVTGASVQITGVLLSTAVGSYSQGTIARNASSPVGSAGEGSGTTSGLDLSFGQAWNGHPYVSWGSGAPTTGNLLVMIYHGVQPTNPGYFVITDSAGGTWNPVLPANTTGAANTSYSSTQVYYRVVQSSDSYGTYPWFSMQASFAPAPGYFTVYEFTGAVNGWYVDQSNYLDNTSGTAQLTYAVSLGQFLGGVSEFVIAGIGQSGIKVGGTSACKVSFDGATAVGGVDVYGSEYSYDQWATVANSVSPGNSATWTMTSGGGRGWAATYAISLLDAVVDIATANLTATATMVGVSTIVWNDHTSFTGLATLKGNVSIATYGPSSSQLGVLRLGAVQLGGAGNFNGGLFSASATLLGIAKLLIPETANLMGSALLSGMSTSYLPVSVSMVGTAMMLGTSVITRPESAQLVATATLVGQSYLTLGFVAEMVGSATLFGFATVTQANSSIGIFTAAASMSAVQAHLVIPAVGSMVGSGTVMANSSNYLPAVASFLGSSKLTGHSIVVFSEQAGVALTAALRASYPTVIVPINVSAQLVMTGMLHAAPSYNVDLTATLVSTLALSAIPSTFLTNTVGFVVMDIETTTQLITDVV